MVKIIPPPEPEKGRKAKKYKIPGGGRAWSPPAVSAPSVLSIPKMEGAQPGKGLGVYVHVPFCRAKCRYCAFYSEAMDMEALEVWLSALEAEAKLWSERLRRPVASSLYLGGGTPSLLPEWAAERAMAALTHAFPLDAKAEVTLEANPESCDRSGMQNWSRLGVNRVSLGVQSLDNTTLDWLGRPHSAAQALGAVEAVRSSGISNLGIDLIWALPGQTQKSWLGELHTAVSLRPDHLSCYSLTVEPGTPLAEIQDLGLPDEEEQAKLYLAGVELLQEHGLLQYEVSNFSRLGFEGCHNARYWAGNDYLGLGPGATSTLKGKRWTAPQDLQLWAQGVTSGQTPWCAANNAETLDKDVRLREMVMLSLRTARGLGLKDYREASGQDFVPPRRKMIEALVARGLARLGQGRFKLSRRGLLVADAIIARLMDD